MISGANEEELELATARMDIMLATNYTPDNPGPLAIIDKYHDKEIDRLNNIIKPKEVNYNYLKLLFEKKDKEEVIKSYVYKCEQLEKLYKSYEEKEIEVMKKDNIINELEKVSYLGRKENEDKGNDFQNGLAVAYNYIYNKIQELQNK